MIEMMRGLRVRLLLGKALFLHRDPKWFEAVRVIREFIGGNIDKTLTELENCKAMGKESSRTDLLWDMAKQLPNKEALLGQIMAVFIPSNDTTSILISNAFYALARNPRIWLKLREEVTALADTSLNFELLRGMKYVNWVLNESKCGTKSPDSSQQLNKGTSSSFISKCNSNGPYGSQRHHLASRWRARPK